MIQPTDDVLHAIVNLEKSNPASFAEFMDWLNRSWTGHLLMCAISEKEPQRSWMQGRCQELRDLVQFIATAEGQLEARKNIETEAAEPVANKFD